MPMILILAAPAVMFSGAGYYLMAVADLFDGAVALTAPAPVSTRRRPQLRVIPGGRF